MSIKQKYQPGETVWIYGITKNNQLTKGTIVKAIRLSEEGFGDDEFYIISIPTHIEPLLEIRTWHTISQDEYGPVGSFRTIGKSFDSENKKMRQTGYMHSRDFNDDEPSPEQIIAALEKSTDGLTHKTLHITEPKTKPKRRYYPKKKK